MIKSKSHRRSIAILLLTGVYIVFHGFFENLLTRTIVTHFLSYCKSTFINDFIFSAVLIYLLFEIIRNFKRVVNVESQITALLFFCLYILYRFYFGVWDFTKFQTLELIAYSDVFAFVSGVYFIVSFAPFLFNSNKEKINEGAFFDDEPVGKNKPDELGYESYALELAKRIESTNKQKSFAVGINGQWGFGKTSFINLLKKNLKKEDKIFIDFNPWSNQTPELIIKDFFETFQKEIRPFYSSLADQLIHYSDKLSAVSKNYFTKFIQIIKLSETIGRSGSHELYKEINSEIKKLNKKVIVFIDDLDRLDKAELLSVIRLIRNTADFHNTFFVAAYDRNYILKAIKEHNPLNHHLFLEKIFQIEVNLPSFNRKILRQKLTDKLASVVSPEHREEVTQAILGDGTSQPAYFDSWVTSLRDVTRLANSLSINFLKLQGEVSFVNFLNLELLRLKYPSVYELLFRDTENFLKTESDSYQKYAYCLKTKSGQQTHVFQSNDLTNFSITEHLENNYESLSVPKNDILKIVDLLSGLFSNQNSFSKRNHLSVVYPSNFNKYFSYALSAGNLSELEFSSYRKKTSLEFNKRISHWVELGLEFEIQSRFQEINDFDDRVDFENIITGIFHLANHEPAIERSYRSRVGFDSESLKNKLYDYDNRISNKYYSDNRGKEGLKNFLLKIFDSANPTYDFESSFILALLKHYPENFPLEQKELESIVLGYFKTYCESIEEYNWSIWNLLHCCKVTDWEPAGGSSFTGKERILDEAKEIFKDFTWNKDTQGILVSMIDREPFKKVRYSLSNIIPRIWGDWDAFHNEFLKVSESDFKTEFEAFYQTYAKSSYSQYVEFDFKIIDLTERFKD